MEFAEVKQIYQREVLKPGIKTAETEQEQNMNAMHEKYGVVADMNKSEAREQDVRAKFLLDYKTNYGMNFNNP